jgi:hypothetical protein
MKNLYFPMMRDGTMRDNQINWKKNEMQKCFFRLEFCFRFRLEWLSDLTDSIAQFSFVNYCNLNQ